MKNTCKTAFLAFVFSSFVFLAILAPTPVFAATATNSAKESSNASPSASPEDTTMELKKRIEKVVEEKREQIKGVISNLLSDKHGFIGEVSRLSQEAITVKQNGDSRIIPLTQNLTIIKKGKKITAQEIEVGNWVTVIGSGSTDKFTPEFLIISTESLRPKDRVVTIGSLTTVGKTSVKIMQRGSSEEREFLIAKTSKLENVDGATIKLTDFDADLSVLVIATKNTKDQWEVVRIRSLSDVKSNN